MAQPDFSLGWPCLDGVGESHPKKKIWTIFQAPLIAKVTAFLCLIDTFSEGCPLPI